MESNIISPFKKETTIVPYKKEKNVPEVKINRRSYRGIQKGNDINKGLYTSIDGQSYSSLEKAIISNKEKFRHELVSKRDL